MIECRSFLDFLKKDEFLIELFFEIFEQFFLCFMGNVHLVEEDQKRYLQGFEVVETAYRIGRDG